MYGMSNPMLGKVIGLVLGIMIILIAGFFGTEGLPIGDTSVSEILLSVGGLGVVLGVLVREFLDTG